MCGIIGASTEFQQFEEGMSYPPPVQTSVSAVNSKCSFVEERGYRKCIPQGTPCFYLKDHGEKAGRKLYLNPGGMGM